MPFAIKNQILFCLTVVSFANNKASPTTKTTGSRQKLRTVVEQLTSHDFLTFWVGTPFSLRLYDGYWHDKLEHKLWSNGLAVKRHSPVLPHIRTLCS